ncbi:hypothetical protein AB0D65_34575 [Streptomyces griseoloalbus]|uniref:Integral membrane protein n=1 Tax=Streptomyces griseoloalbus TaxID=67303 RepID=A0ABV3EGB6_9ACTN
MRAAEAACSRGPWTCVELIEALRYSEPMPMRRALPALTVPVAAMWLLNLVLERFRPALWPTVTPSSPQPFELPNSVWQQEWGRTADGGHYASYHPASHFRPLHLVETGTVLAVAVLATAAAFAALRRRTVRPRDPARPYAPSTLPGEGGTYGRAVGGRTVGRTVPNPVNHPREPPPAIPDVMSP